MIMMVMIMIMMIILNSDDDNCVFVGDCEHDDGCYCDDDKQLSPREQHLSMARGLLNATTIGIHGGFQLLG